MREFRKEDTLDSPYNVVFCILNTIMNIWNKVQNGVISQIQTNMFMHFRIHTLKLPKFRFFQTMTV